DPGEPGELAANDLEDLDLAEPRDEEAELPVRGRLRGRARGPDEGPGAHAAVDQPLLLQLPQRPPDRRTRDAEPPAELRLTGQAPARCVLAVGDIGQQLAGDLAVTRFAGHGDLLDNRSSCHVKYLTYTPLLSIQLRLRSRIVCGRTRRTTNDDDRTSGARSGLLGPALVADRGARRAFVRLRHRSDFGNDRRPAEGVRAGGRRAGIHRGLRADRDDPGRA